jgi:class 3 adenylate cyclase
VSRSTTVTVLFCDLVESTARFTRIGDDAADAFLLRFRGACARAVESHHGQVVKHLGDGVMAVFTTSSLDALLAARDLHDFVRSLDSGDPPRLRIGVSVGDVSASEGDWYGTPVIEASRLCDVAAPAQTFTTPTVRAIVGSRGDLSFVDVSSLELKGLPSPVDVVRVSSPDDDDTTTAATSRSASGSRQSRRPLLIAGIALAVVAIAVPIAIVHSGDGRTSASSGAVADLGYRPTYEQRACAPGAIDGQTCGVLHVPERRDQPDGRRDQVVVDEFSPVSPGKRVTLMVGVVEPTGDQVARFGATLLYMTRRGAAGDPTLNCPEMAAAASAHLDDPILSPPSVSASLGAISTCANRWDQQGVDRSAYGAGDVADDVRDLVIAKHLPPIDLEVSTDDTAVGLDLMRDDPGMLRTVTLENPIPPTATSSDYVRAYAEALDSFATVCKQDPTCSRYLPDPVGAWAAMYRRLEGTPQRITGPLPDGSETSVLIDGDRAASVFATAVSNTTLTPFVPQILSSGAVGQIAYNARDRSGVDNLPYGQQLTDLCERVAPLDQPGDRYAAAAQPQNAVGIWNMALLDRTCEVWKVTPDPDRSRQTVTSNIPVLVVSGALAVTARQDGFDDFETGLSHMFSFRFPTIGFAALHYAPSCFQQMRLAWLRKPTTVPDRSQIQQCEAASPAIGFYG